jgi:DNA polymerase/3'-5' exonuclease PolX
MDFKPVILENLEIMRLGDEIRGEHFSSRAYEKAKKVIISHTKPIQKVTDVAELGLGPKISLKLKEIIETGKLAAAERTKEELNIDLYRSLLKVHGIGPAKAKELVETHKIKSLDELKAKKNLLTNAQQIGLKFYDDIELRIPRDEMLAHESTLEAIIPVHSVGKVVGSFRRGAESSGDIDFLLTFDSSISSKEQKRKFREMIEFMEEVKYLKATLALGDKKFMGVVQIADDLPARRIDILLCPPEEYAYSVLYFTGSDIFNVAMRKHALTLGYSLNEHTLKKMRDDVADIPEMKTEKDIFKFLGIKYVKPSERNTTELKFLTKN